MKKRPCTRGLQAFADGCPKRPWDAETGDGCPLWIEKEVPTIQDPNPKMKRMCIDNWKWHWGESIAGHVAGCQAAIETLRNGLLFYDEETKTVSPKPDYAMRELVKMVKKTQLLLDENEGKEELLTIVDRESGKAAQKFAERK